MRSLIVLASAMLIVAVDAAALAQKNGTDLEKALAGPRATVLRETMLYVVPDKQSDKVARVQPGRELVVAQVSGPWVRVFANTDVEKEREEEQPVFGSEPAPPVSGWMEARGVVKETTAGGDAVLMGEAANEEALASDPKGPANAARSARLLYRRLVEMFPDSPYAAEAMWRAADIRWQIEKADAATLSSSHEKDPVLREGMYEDEMKKILKSYPRSRQAELAAFELLDNKLCGDWQGDVKCPARESALYEKYAAEYPDGVKTAEALYLAVYRQASIGDMLQAEGGKKEAEAARRHAHELAAHLKEKFPHSDYSVRAGAVVYKLDEGIPVYGIDLQ